jgi:hypothetical protein
MAENQTSDHEQNRQRQFASGTRVRTDLNGRFRRGNTSTQLRNVATTLGGERKSGFVTSVDSMRPSVIGQSAARLRLSQRHEFKSQPPNEKREPQLDDPRPRVWISPSKWR